MSGRRGGRPSRSLRNVFAAGGWPLAAAVLGLVALTGGHFHPSTTLPIPLTVALHRVLRQVQVRVPPLCDDLLRLEAAVDHSGPRRVFHLPRHGGLLASSCRVLPRRWRLRVRPRSSLSRNSRCSSPGIAEATCAARPGTNSSRGLSSAGSDATFVGTSCGFCTPTACWSAIAALGALCQPLVEEGGEATLWQRAPGGNEDASQQRTVARSVHVVEPREAVIRMIGRIGCGVDVVEADAVQRDR
jgi:hypothetical protein